MLLVEALNQLMQFAFVLVTLVTFLDYRRHRTTTRLDIHLMFASVGLVMLVQLLSQTVGLTLKWLDTVGLLAFLAQPYLLLHLTAHFRPLAPAIRWASLGGLLLSWTLYTVLLPPLPLIAVLFMVAYFALVEGYAAWSFVQGAATSGGVAQRRFLFAAIGSGCLALVLIITGFSQVTGSPEARNITALLSPALAIVCALAYYLGFVPPMWLRRSWQLQELYTFMGELGKHRPDARLDDVFQTLCSNPQCRRACHGCGRARRDQ